MPQSAGEPMSGQFPPRHKNHESTLTTYPLFSFQTKYPLIHFRTIHKLPIPAQATCHGEWLSILSKFRCMVHDLMHSFSLNNWWKLFTHQQEKNWLLSSGLQCDLNLEFKKNNQLDKDFKTVRRFFKTILPMCSHLGWCVTSRNNKFWIKQNVHL